MVQPHIHYADWAPVNVAFKRGGSACVQTARSNTHLCCTEGVPLELLVQQGPQVMVHKLHHHEHTGASGTNHHLGGREVQGSVGWGVCVSEMEVAYAWIKRVCTS